MVASRLGLQDWRNLRRVNKPIYLMLKDEKIAREVVKRNIAFTKEGKRVRKGRIAYYEALARVSGMREAYATANPYSATLLARGKDFIYNDGVLCYASSSELRI
ncbi:hypothetical protein FQN54_008105, partial [Arachnomyces sp. PD_36]